MCVCLRFRNTGFPRMRWRNVIHRFKDSLPSAHFLARSILSSCLRVCYNFTQWTQVFNTCWVKLGFEHIRRKISIFNVAINVDWIFQSSVVQLTLQRLYFVECWKYDCKYFVCCQGVAELRSEMCAIALREKYMGERIPEVWLNFETTMMK